jgi:Xaa-Pro dipeptidase
MSATIQASEYVDRQQRALAVAAERGLAGLVVWSRCGTSVDYYGDVFYLTNHYSPFAVIQDRLPYWSGRGHSVLIAPVDGEAILVTDNPEVDRDAVHVGEVRSSLLVLETVADALRETGLATERFGLSGRQALLASNRDGLEELLGRRLQLEFADDILATLRRVKSDAELDCLRHAARVGNEWVATMMRAVAPGRTEGEIVGEGLRYLAANDGWPYDVSVASGPNAHRYGRVGVPSWDSVRPLQTGDLVHIDGWGPVGGYFADLFRSTVVGGEPTGAQREVLDGSIELIHHIVAGVRPGVAVGELYGRGATWLQGNGFGEHRGDPDATGTRFADLFPAFGHGLGLGIETPWIVEDDPTPLEANMVLAAECLVGRPGVGAAGFEEVFVVTSSGCELLTEGCPARWWS